jgi:hypothetical protein
MAALLVAPESMYACPPKTLAPVEAKSAKLVGYIDVVGGVEAGCCELQLRVGNKVGERRRAPHGVHRTGDR